jgi:hypothetical protein
VSHLTSCTSTKSNLYLANSLATFLRDPDLHRLTTCTKSHFPFLLLRSYQRISPVPRHMYPFRNKVSFYGEEVLAPPTNHKLEDHLLSAVRDCLFNTFTSTLHIGARSCNRNVKSHHAMVTEAQLSRRHKMLFNGPIVRKQTTTKIMRIMQ